MSSMRRYSSSLMVLLMSSSTLMMVFFCHCYCDQINEYALVEGELTNDQLLELGNLLVHAINSPLAAQSVEGTSKRRGNDLVRALDGVSEEIERRGLQGRGAFCTDYLYGAQIDSYASEENDK